MKMVNSFASCHAYTVYTRDCNIACDLTVDDKWALVYNNIIHTDIHYKNALYNVTSLLLQ